MHFRKTCIYFFRFLLLCRIQILDEGWQKSNRIYEGINILRILKLEMILDTSTSAININQPPTISLKLVHLERLRNILKRYNSYSISIIGYYFSFGGKWWFPNKNNDSMLFLYFKRIGRVSPSRDCTKAQICLCLEDTCPSKYTFTRIWKIRKRSGVTHRL